MDQKQSTPVPLEAIPFVVLQIALLIAGLISLFSKPLAFKDKWMWLPLLFVNIIGPIIYFAVGSKSLDKKYESQQMNS